MWCDWGREETWVIMRDRPVSSFFLSQFFFLHRTPGISCGRGFGSNKLSSSIQKPLLERAVSFTIGHTDFYLALFSVRQPISILLWPVFLSWGLFGSTSLESNISLLLCGEKAVTISHGWGERICKSWCSFKAEVFQSLGCSPVLASITASVLPQIIRH